MHISNFDNIHSLVAQLFLDWKIVGFQNTLIHTYTHTNTHIYLSEIMLHISIRYFVRGEIQMGVTLVAVCVRL